MNQHRTSVLAVVVGVLTAWLWSGASRPNDLASLWIGGMVLNDGQIEELYTRHPVDFSRWDGEVWGRYIEAADIGHVAGSPHPFVQIPLVARFFGWLSTWMSFDVLLVIITGLSGAAAVWIIACSWRLWFRDQIPLPWLLVGTGLLWLSSPFQQAVSIGQTTPLIVAGLVFALAYAADRPAVAGLVLAVVAVVKLTPAALIVACLLFARTRRAGAWGTGGLAVLAGLSWIVDSAAMGRWTDMLGETTSAGILALPNQALTSYLLEGQVERADMVGAELVTDVPGWITGVVYAVVALVLALTVWSAWRRQGDRPFEIFAVGGYGASLLLANIMWLHYLVAVPVFLVGVFYLTRHLVIRVIASVGVVLLFDPFIEPSIALEPLIGDWAGLLGLLVILAAFFLAANLPGYSPASTDGRSPRYGRHASNRRPTGHGGTLRAR